MARLSRITPASTSHGARPIWYLTPPAATLSGTLADNAAASDVLARVSTQPRVLADNSAATDVVVRSAYARTRSITDSAAASDVLAAAILDALHPDGVISNTGWTDQIGGTTNIWQSVDELVPDDADYIMVTG